MEAAAAFLPFILSAVVFLLLLEQLAYIRKKGPLPGPPLVVPILGGNVFKIARDPAGFFDEQAAQAKVSGLGLSANYLLGRFVIFIRDTSLTHEVLANVRPDTFHIAANIFGKGIFMWHDVKYYFEKKHRAMRRRMALNTPPRQLATYCAMQQQVIAKHLQMWLEAYCAPTTTPLVKLHQLLRDMNDEISIDVFARPYLSPELRRLLRDGFNHFSRAILSLPVDLPGFAFHRALRARTNLTQTFTGMVRESRTRMRAGEEPSCVIDFWVEEDLKELDRAAEAGVPPPPMDSFDELLGIYITSTLFGALDTTVSSLTWAVALLTKHQKVVERIRSEVSKTIPSYGVPLITWEALSALQYTRAVAKELMRVSTPAEAVARIASDEFKLSNGYTIPKGSLVFISLRESSLQEEGFPDADRFDPDRFMEPRKEDLAFKKHFLPFGSGAQRCAGQRYALSLLTLFVAMFVSVFDFERDPTDGCDRRTYRPMSTPMDDCAVLLRGRCVLPPTDVCGD